MVICWPNIIRLGRILILLSVTAVEATKKTKSSSLELIGWGDSQFSVNDAGVITSGAYYPNIFSPANYYKLQTTKTLAEKRLNSVFATAQFGYKGRSVYRC